MVVNKEGVGDTGQEATDDSALSGDDPRLFEGGSVGTQTADDGELVDDTEKSVLLLLLLLLFCLRLLSLLMPQ